MLTHGRKLMRLQPGGTRLTISRICRPVFPTRQRTHTLLDLVGLITSAARLATLILNTHLSLFLAASSAWYITTCLPSPRCCPGSWEARTLVTPTLSAN